MARAGFLYQQQAPAEEVEPLLRRAAKLAPTDAEVQSNLGIFLFLRRRDLPGAEGQFRLAIQAAPQEPNYHANLASVLLCQGTAQALQQARAGVDAVLRLPTPT
jgi:Flp pilus assembly protein TadD